METTIKIGACPEEIKMPSGAKLRARKVLSLCKKMKMSGILIYIGNEPFCYASSPEFISKMNSLFPLDLNIVYNGFSEDLLEIQKSRAKHMEEIMSKK